MLLTKKASLSRMLLRYLFQLFYKGGLEVVVPGGTSSMGGVGGGGGGVSSSLAVNVTEETFMGGVGGGVAVPDELPILLSISFLILLKPSLILSVGDLNR